MTNETLITQIPDTTKIVRKTRKSNKRVVGRKTVRKSGVTPDSIKRKISQALKEYFKTHSVWNKGKTAKRKKRAAK